MMIRKLTLLGLTLVAGVAILAGGAFAAGGFAPQSVVIVGLDAQTGPDGNDVLHQRTGTDYSDGLFLGYSNDRYRGYDGILTFNRSCRSKFGAGARLCTTEEYQKSNFTNARPSSPGAWVHPNPKFSQNDDWFTEFTGMRRHLNSSSYGGSCRGWSISDSGWYGVYINTQGRIHYNGYDCWSSQLYISCCRSE